MEMIALRKLTTRRRAQAVRLYARHRSQCRVARRMGISQPAVCKLLTGASVDLTVARNSSEVVNIVAEVRQMALN
jgi:predicted transcriptional regulator